MNAFAQPPGLSAGMPMPCNGFHRLPRLSRAFTFAATGHFTPPIFSHHGACTALLCPPASLAFNLYETHHFSL